MLAQEGEEKEKAMQYLSKKFFNYYVHNTQIEKTCLVVVWATKEHRHYILNNNAKMVARVDPLHDHISQPVLHIRIS